LNPAYPVYAISAVIYFAALVLVIIKLRGMITQFHFCLFFFSVELFLASFPMMADDVYGRTHISAPLVDTQIMILGSAVFLLVASLFLRRGREYSLTDYRVVTRIPRQPLMLGLLAISAFSSFSSYRKLGTFPIFVLAHEGAQYSEVFEGVVTFVGWGTARALALWLVMEMAMTSLNVRRFVVHHFLLIGCTAGAIFLNVLDGQRNMLILPALLAVFALSRRGALKTRLLVPAGAVILFFFLALGTFRAGEHRSSSSLRHSSGNESLDNAVGHLVTYLEPNVHNLNNLVILHPRPYMGKILLYTIVPNKLLNLFLTAPESAVSRLYADLYFSQPGLTFRTVFADFYADFGGIGSLLFGTLYYMFAVACFNRASSRPRFMLINLILAQGIIFFPFMNNFLGFPVIVQLSTLIFLRYETVDEEAGFA
jgi:oligosaccharide repeat unit polymerase